MKKAYIIGAAIGLLFVCIAVFSFDSTKIEYADFLKAKSVGKTVQVIGSWSKDIPYSYNSEKNEFTFLMADEKGNKTKVVCDGAKPNNFDIAPMVVIKGKFKGDSFHATDILTKCPSKYEGQADELKGKTLYN
jgi:cytochrome c-type biogenesis protein CcmE